MSKNSSVVYEEKSTYVEIKKQKGIPKIFIILFVIFILLMGALVIWLLVRKNNGNIKTVKRVLKNKYYSVICLDTNCDGAVAYSGNKNGKYKVTLISDGEVISTYNDEYNADKAEVKEPFAVAKNYYIKKTVNTKENKIVEYTLVSKNGKELYKTKNNLGVLTDELAIMDSTSEDGSSYTIIDSKGKVKINGIANFDTYNDGKLVSLSVNGDRELIDSKGNLLLNGYSVSKEVKDDNNKVLYIIIKDTKNNAYYYYSTGKNKIVGDSFQSFKVLEDKTLEIQKDVNNEVVNYYVNHNGKQTKKGTKKTQSVLVSELKKTIDSTKYNIYSIVLEDESDKYVFADNLEEKTFGVYSIKDKKYEKLYSYKEEESIMNSTIYNVDSGKDRFYQVTCSSYACDSSIFVLYDLKNNKLLYKQEDADKVIQNYTQYKNDYKVIKYSTSTANEDYKSKYVLLDNNNKELIKSDKAIVVVDQEEIIKANVSSSVLLFSSKTNKLLNDEKNLANIMKISNKNYYKYYKDNKTIIVNNKGKELVNIDSKSDITYGDGVIMYIASNNINMLDANTGKTKKYTLRENEKMNDASGVIIPVIRGAVFVNNSANNYIKVVGTNGRTIKKINNSEINKVYNMKDGNVLIITKSDSESNILYGMYIAK